MVMEFLFYGPNVLVNHQGPSINDVGNFGGIKNWSKLSTDNSKKLPKWGRKNCRRVLWMVPRRKMRKQLFLASVANTVGYP